MSTRTPWRFRALPLAFLGLLTVGLVIGAGQDTTTPGFPKVAEDPPVVRVPPGPDRVPPAPPARVLAGQTIDELVTRLEQVRKERVEAEEQHRKRLAELDGQEKALVQHLRERHTQQEERLMKARVLPAPPATTDVTAPGPVPAPKAPK